MSQSYELMKDADAIRRVMDLAMGNRATRAIAGYYEPRIRNIIVRMEARALELDRAQHPPAAMSSSSRGGGRP